MINRQKLIEKDYVLYLIDYFGRMQTWSKEDVLAEIARKVKEAKPVYQPPADQWIPCSEAVDIGYLYDWYIASVTDAEPVWTEAHLEELCNDFIIIPKPEPYKGVVE